MNNQKKDDSEIKKQLKRKNKIFSFKSSFTKKSSLKIFQLYLNLVNSKLNDR